MVNEVRLTVSRTQSRLPFPGFRISVPLQFEAKKGHPVFLGLGLGFWQSKLSGVGFKGILSRSACPP